MLRRYRETKKLSTEGQWERLYYWKQKITGAAEGGKRVIGERSPLRHQWKLQTWSASANSHKGQYNVLMYKTTVFLAIIAVISPSLLLALKEQPPQAPNVSERLSQALGSEGRGASV
jgi:hypothetical protein